jgi:hypothetical protein
MYCLHLPPGSSAGGAQAAVIPYGERVVEVNPRGQPIDALAWNATTRRTVRTADEILLGSVQLIPVTRD